MSIETRSRSKKRSRPETFDLDRSRQYIAEKKRKDSREMEQQNTPKNNSVRDMSQTINTASSGLNQNAREEVRSEVQRGPGVSANAEGGSTVLHRALENRVQVVQNEIGDIRRTLGDLARAIESLTANTTSNMMPNSSSNMNQMDVARPVVTPPAVEIPMADNVSGVQKESSVPRNGYLGASLDRDRMRIRIDKLGLVFDGTSRGLGVEDFVYRLEHYQRQYAIPWEEVIRDFPLVVTGPAESWYWLFQKTHRFHDWQELKHCLLSQYQSSRSNFEILTDLAQRKQQLNESIDVFFHIMGQMRAKLIQPVSEYDMIKIMKKNVKESIGRIVYPIQVSSMEQLRIECNEAERNFPRRDVRNMPPPNRPIRQINELCHEPPEYLSETEYESIDYNEVAAFQTNRQSAISCWNCRQAGHGFRDCDSTVRSLFCYKCGKPGFTTPKCPVCQQGNPNKGVDLAGEPRPRENPKAQ
uniref:CCHC-type domain-containing protein n=1 Tax=Stomoxys calcitrans TaxID=35570 RepID=A0A1I8PZ74_STOCA